MVRLLLPAAPVLLLLGPVGTAPLVAPAAAAPAPTTQQRLEFGTPGTHSLTIPQGATAVEVVLAGAGEPGRGGAEVTASAAVGANGPLRPGEQLTVRIDSGATDLRRLGDPLFRSLLLAPAAGGTGQPYSDTSVFPAPSARATANTGPGRAVVVFTVPQASIGGVPETMDLGSSPVGTPVVRSLAVRSAGPAPLSITGVLATGPFAIENRGTTCVPGGAPIAVGSTCTIAVQFTPGARGSSTGGLRISGNIAGGGLDIALSGVAATAPAAPTSVTATPGPSQVALSWMPPADDGGMPVTSFEISRTGGADSVAETVVGSVPADTLLWTDTGLVDGTSYTYVIRAVNDLGHSAPSTAVVAVPIKGLVVASTSLPGAIVGMPYRAVVTAEGGVAPYRWAIDGALPAGFEFNPDTGELTGTPLTAGSFVIELRATDSALPTRAETTANLALTVANQPQQSAAPGAPVALAPADGTAHGNGGIGLDVWLWSVVGAAGLGAAAVALHRLRRDRAAAASAGAGAGASAGGAAGGRATGGGGTTTVAVTPDIAGDVAPGAEGEPDLDEDGPGDVPDAPEDSPEGAADEAPEDATDEATDDAADDAADEEADEAADDAPEED